MEKCSKCGDSFGPLKLHAHTRDCNGKSNVPKENRPGKVKSSGARASSDSLMRRSESDVFNTASTRRGLSPKEKK
jgi:hypothetical protein